MRPRINPAIYCDAHIKAQVTNLECVCVSTCKNSMFQQPLACICVCVFVQLSLHRTKLYELLQEQKFLQTGNTFPVCLTWIGDVTWNQRGNLDILVSLFFSRSVWLFCHQNCIYGQISKCLLKIGCHRSPLKSHSSLVKVSCL